MFWPTLHVYTTVECKVLADDEATLASIRTEGFSGGDFAVKGNMKVATFEKKVAELYDIGVQVANADEVNYVLGVYKGVVRVVIKPTTKWQKAEYDENGVKYPTSRYYIEGITESHEGNAL